MYDLNKDHTWQKGVIRSADEQKAPSQAPEPSRDRAQTFYGGNNPSGGSVDQQGHGIEQPDVQQTQRDRAQTFYGGNDPSGGSVDQQGRGIEQDSQQPRRSGRPLPQTPPDGVQRAWSGKFVSTYGGYGEKNQGLLFKPTGVDAVHHFNEKETQQLRASDNSDLIKESMTHGSQGKDVVVTFSANDGKASWGVEPLNNQRPGHGR